jgi:GDP-mannose 6-dehydrogenase
MICGKAPVVALLEPLEQLIGKGRNVRVFDPQILPDRIYGSKQRYLLAAIPLVGKLFDPNLDQMLAWADHFAASGLPTIDLVNTVSTPQRVAQSATSG